MVGRTNEWVANPLGLRRLKEFSKKWKNKFNHLADTKRVEKMRKFYAIHSSHLFINIQGSFLIKIILVWNLQIPISPQLSLHFKYVPIKIK